MNLPHIVEIDIGKLFQAWIVFIAYFVGKEVFHRLYAGRVQRTLRVFGTLIVLALLAYGTVGTHVEDSDPIYGGGETVQDYSPSSQQRCDAAIDVFILIGVPMFIGAFRSEKSLGYS